MDNTKKNDEVFIEDTINASVEKVYNAWTNPEKLMQWFAPEGCSIKFKTLDIKPGGCFHSYISNPQFGDCWCIGTYKEIELNTKLVFTMMNTDEHGNRIDPTTIGMDAEWPAETIVTIIFREENGKTKLQLRQTVLQEIAKKTGAYPSWLQMLNKLKAIIK